MTPDRHDEIADAPTAVAYLKERVYVSFTGLAIVLVLFDRAEHVDPPAAFTTLLVGLLGVTAAAFASDVIAHLSVHHEFPDAKELLVLLRISLGSLSTAVAPLAMIALAWLGVLRMEPALAIATYIYIAILGVVGWLAVRHAHLRMIQKLIALAMLFALALAVVLIQMLAHGH